MSFIEQNKAWILPLLGVAAAGVVYLNVRVASSPSPSPVAPEAAPLAAPPSSPEKAESADLWEDLRTFAAPPAALAEEGGFRDQARRSAADALQDPAPPEGLSIPSGVREPRPAPDPEPKAGGGFGMPAGPPPGLDFLIQGPAGARAWLDGRPYRSGESVTGQALSVGAIGSTSVELKGPKGRTVLSTNPLHHSRPSTQPAVEAP